MRDDVLYAIVLVLSLSAGLALPVLRPRTRRAASAALGILLLLGTCGPTGALYPLGCVLSAYGVLVLAPRGTRGRLCFCCAFGGLGLLRLLGSPSGPANAVQLVLTLRLASLGFDVDDDTLRAAHPEGNLHGDEETPPLLLLLEYSFCYHGLFTGPFYRYAQWANAMSSGAQASLAPERIVRLATGRALAVALLTLAVWCAAATGLPYRPMSIGEDWWLEWPIHRRLAYFYASSFQQRYRFYVCWSVVEAAGHLARFSSPANVRPLQCETACSPSALIAGWNVSVHYFLRDYVYRRLPIRGRSARQFITFGVSAFWHGLRPGYYLFFSGLFGMVCVEQLVRAAMGRLGSCIYFHPAVEFRSDSDSDVLDSRGSTRNDSRLLSDLHNAAAGGQAAEGKMRNGSSFSFVEEQRASQVDRLIRLGRLLGSPIVRRSGQVVSHLWTMGCLTYFGAAFNVLGFAQTQVLWRSLHFYGLWLLAVPAAFAAAVLIVVPNVSTSRTLRGKGSTSLSPIPKAHND